MSCETPAAMVEPDNVGQTDDSVSLQSDGGSVVSVDGLGKCYRLWDSPQSRLKQPLRSLLARWLPIEERQYFHDFWALRNISLNVGKGETVGIIGRNGSGKSTLLQILCGTLAPTCGTVHTKGRISALLELGSGFNPECTGKENVYMNASILGLSTEEITERYEAIVEFADIGQFIDQPVKMYSSGMTVRLAFAVAINVDPDILIVDEALSVGDDLFQHKCFSRIHSIQENGGTILFVSHSAGAVVELCDRAVLLDGGDKIFEGKPKLAVANYHRLLNAPRESHEQVRSEILLRASSSEIRGTVCATDTNDCSEGSEDLEQAFFDENLVPKETVFYCKRGATISQAFAPT